MSATPAAERLERRFYAVLALLLLASLLLRLGYVYEQAGTDPRFVQPGFDGEYYLDWAGALAGVQPD